MSKELNRRGFVGHAAGLALGVELARAGAAGEERSAPEEKVATASAAPSERIRIALIGCGGMGRADLRDFLKFPQTELVALCDVDTRRWGEALADVTAAGRPTEKVQTAQDFRHVLDRKDVDAVIVGTPDHWHAIPTILACQAGKDVYCEKPLAHSIVEGRAMVNAAKKHRRVVQIGTQQRSGKHFQEAVQYVQSGKLGKVHCVRTWINNRNNSPDGDGNPPDGDPPKEVDYDLWLGPAPLRAFNPVRFHYNYRWFFDYGNGLCNDWGVHLNDIVLWAMKEKAPRSVVASGGKYVLTDISDTPDTMEVMYEYPTFTHVYSIRRCCDNAGFRSKSHGIEFQGSNGTLVLTRGGWFVLAEINEDKPRIKTEMHPGSDQHKEHVEDFLECVKTRGQTRSEIEAMHHATATCHLANISLKTGKKIYWDPEKERCMVWDGVGQKWVGEDAQANAYLFREPRKPWTIPLEG
ncbi:MAG: Gfo/Idh/MocA family oxidoreductase [Planctomycetota bacterium]